MVLVAQVCGEFIEKRKVKVTNAIDGMCNFGRFLFISMGGCLSC